MKKLIALLVFLLTFTTTYADDHIKVFVDSVPVSFDVQPTIINGRTMVPVRAIFEALGAKVDWHGETSTVTAKKDNETVSMKIGSKELYYENLIIPMDTPPILLNDRTLVPARFAAEAFGNTVSWDPATGYVYIDSGKKPDIQYYRRYQNIGLSMSILYPSDWHLDESFSRTIFIDNQSDSLATQGMGIISLAKMNFINSSFADTVSARYDYLISDSGANITEFKNITVNECAAALFKYVDAEGDYVTSYLIGGMRDAYLIEFISDNKDAFNDIYNTVLSSFTIF